MQAINTQFNEKLFKTNPIHVSLSKPIDPSQYNKTLIKPKGRSVKLKVKTKNTDTNINVKTDINGRPLTSYSTTKAINPNQYNKNYLRPQSARSYPTVGRQLTLNDKIAEMNDKDYKEDRLARKYGKVPDQMDYENALKNLIEASSDQQKTKYKNMLGTYRRLIALNQKYTNQGAEFPQDKAKQLNDIKDEIEKLVVNGIPTPPIRINTNKPILQRAIESKVLSYGKPETSSKIRNELTATLYKIDAYMQKLQRLEANLTGLEDEETQLKQDIQDITDAGKKAPQKMINKLKTLTSYIDKLDAQYKTTTENLRLEEENRQAIENKFAELGVSETILPAPSFDIYEEKQPQENTDAEDMLKNIKVALSRSKATIEALMDQVIDQQSHGIQPSPTLMNALKEAENANEQYTKSYLDLQDRLTQGKTVNLEKYRKILSGEQDLPTISHKPDIQSVFVRTPVRAKFPIAENISGYAEAPLEMKEEAPLELKEEAPQAEDFANADQIVYAEQALRNYKTTKQSNKIFLEELETHAPAIYAELISKSTKGRLVKYNRSILETTVSDVIRSLAGRPARARNPVGRPKTPKKPIGSGMKTTYKRKNKIDDFVKHKLRLKM